MKQCRSEGELRTYLDGELPAEAMASVAAHLSDCRPCAASVEALTARAHRVSALLGELGGADLPVCLPVRRSRPRWLPAAIALAAALALAFVLLPRRQPHARPPAAPMVAAAPVAPLTPPVPPVVARAVRPARAHKQAPSRKPEPEYFLALDNEPFEVGVVRRVALGPDEIPADMVFSPDGRPRAIRLVSDSRN